MSEERVDPPLTVACLVTHGLPKPFCPGAARYWELLPFSRERVSVQEGSPLCPLSSSPSCVPAWHLAGLAPGASGHWAQLPSPWAWSGAQCVCEREREKEREIGKCLSVCGWVKRLVLHDCNWEWIYKSEGIGLWVCHPSRVHYSLQLTMQQSACAQILKSESWVQKLSDHSRALSKLFYLFLSQVLIL